MICKICGKPINSFNKKRGAHIECKHKQPYLPSRKEEKPFERKKA